MKCKLLILFVVLVFLVLWSKAESAETGLKYVLIRWNGPSTRSVPEVMLVSSNSMTILENWIEDNPLMRKRDGGVLIDSEVAGVNRFHEAFVRSQVKINPLETGFVIEMVFSGKTNSVFLGMGSSATNQIAGLKSALKERNRRKLALIDRLVDAQVRSERNSTRQP